MPSAPARQTSDDPYSNPNYQAAFQEPSVFDKLKFGALMGGMVGGGAGFLVGSFIVLRSVIPADPRS